MQTHEIYLQNLKCGGCAATVRTKVGSIQGIEVLEVDLEAHRVRFQTEETAAGDLLQRAKEVLRQAGYPEVGADNTLANKAMSYVSCAIGRIEGAD
ncbi:heavy metal transporter [bacterium]|nr:heavy metal transporter [bacterium]